MLTIPLEDGVLTYGNFDVQIAGRAAITARFTLTAQTDAIACVDARRDLHRKRFSPPHPPLAQARIAGIFDYGARPAAMRTGLLQLEEALRHAHLPHATAGF